VPGGLAELYAIPARAHLLPEGLGCNQGAFTGGWHRAGRDERAACRRAGVAS
jgi:hypothetical protein